MKKTKLTKRESKIFQDAHKLGFESGECYVKGKVLHFVDKESEFITDALTDSLLDRLVDYLKKI